jgi:hypothetical protein
VAPAGNAPSSSLAGILFGVALVVSRRKR